MLEGMLAWYRWMHGINNQQSTSIMGINERLSMDIRIVIQAGTLRFGGYVKVRILFGYPGYYLGQHHSTTYLISRRLYLGFIKVLLACCVYPNGVDKNYHQIPIAYRYQKMWNTHKSKDRNES